jgi:hypothetical protein
MDAALDPDDLAELDPVWAAGLRYLTRPSH